MTLISMSNPQVEESLKVYHHSRRAVLPGFRTFLDVVREAGGD